MHIYLSLALCVPLLAGGDDPSLPSGGITYHLSTQERERIDEALERAATWLASLQDESGAIPPRGEQDLSRVLINSMALWATAEVDSAGFPLQQRLRCVGFLCRFRKVDGRFHDPEHGLAPFYTTGVAGKALKAVNRITGSRQIDEFAQAAHGYVEQHLLSTTWEPALGDLLKLGTLSQEEQQAVKFLSGIAPDRTLYPGEKGGEERSLVENFPLCLFTEMSREEVRVVRAYRDAVSQYTLDTPSPLARHFEEWTMMPKETARYVHYLAMARILGLTPAPVIKDGAGSRRDWPRDLSQRLLETQKEAGFWGSNGVEPVLATSYAMLALVRCRDAAAASSSEARETDSKIK